MRILAFAIGGVTLLVVLLSVTLFRVTSAYSLATIERVSISSNGSESNASSRAPATSGDGRYVAFESSASNLVVGDSNGVSDVFVHDRATGLTERVSVASDGNEGTSFGGMGSYSPSISGDGRYVAFASTSNNLVPGDSNTADDIFVRDRQTQTTHKVSVTSTGAQPAGANESPDISSVGRFVAFVSVAPVLAPSGFDVLVHDRQSGITETVSVAPDGTPGNGFSGGLGLGGETGISQSAAISGDGRFAAFESLASNLVTGDTNAAPDIFVRDRLANQTQRASTASNGNQADENCPACGSYKPAISSNGQTIAFTSIASSLVPEDTNGTWDVFLKNLTTGETQLISKVPGGAQGNSLSGAPSVSADGSEIAFVSLASNLLPGDNNDTWDVFVVQIPMGSSPTPVPLLSPSALVMLALVFLAALVLTMHRRSHTEKLNRW